jgi:hypothetical protein
MGRLARIKTTNRKMSGFYLRLPDGHEQSAFDMRPQRFKFFHGANTSRKKAQENAEEVLTQLVNLPEDPKSIEISDFIDTHHNLALGKIAAPERPAPITTPEEIIRFRNLYRQFWMSLSGAYKANLFMTLVDPWPIAWHSPIQDMAGEQVEAYSASKGAIYPYADYRHSALRINWKTSRYEIACRGPVDWLTDAAFRNRNRLRICSNPNCKQVTGGRKFFIAKRPYRTNKPCSDTCAKENELASKRKCWDKNYSKTARSAKQSAH